MASTAAGHILGQALVPNEATTRLLQWLGEKFGNNATFRAVVVGRIVGQNSFSALSKPWEAAKEQISRAQQFDSSLFMVEEQNLFVDEVRETYRWISVFNMISWDGQDSSLTMLDSWVRSGLGEMRQLIQKEDGPLGWASRPDVFAICARVVHAAAALKQGYASENLSNDIKGLHEILSSKEHHTSLLLVGPLLESN